MEQLIKIEQKQIGTKIINAVFAREFYLNLGLAQAAWARWYKIHILENEYFFENKDWMGFNIMLNGNSTQDFIISLEMAKHLAMMAKTPESHKLRDYFIECEKIVHSQNIQPQFQLPQTYKEALLALAAEVDKTERLTFENQTLKPKAEFYETVTGSSDTIEMGEVAKVLNLGIGRNKIFALLRMKGLLQHNNAPYQSYVDKKYFRRVESSFIKPDGTAHINIKTVVYQRGVDAIRKLILNNQDILDEMED